MNRSIFLIFATLCVSAQAQESTPAPKKSPFAGFGSTGLDRPARPGVPPSKGNGAPSGSMLDVRPPSPAPAAPRAAPAGSLPTVMPGEARGFNLEAKLRFTGGAIRREQGGGFEVPISADKTSTVSRESREVLDVLVRNVAHQNDTARLEWYFTGRSVERGTLYAWDQGEREVTVPANGSYVAALESLPLTKSTTVSTTYYEDPRFPPSSGRGTRFVANATEQRFGAGAHGWIVRLFVSGKLIKVEASSYPLRMMGWDQAQLDALAPAKSTAPPALP